MGQRGATENATTRRRQLETPVSTQASLDPPAHLDAVARDFWNRNAPALAKADMLSPQDYDSFALLACVYSKLIELQTDLTESRKIKTFNDLLGRYQSLARQFCLLPTARRQQAVSFGSNLDRYDEKEEFEF